MTLTEGSGCVAVLRDFTDTRVWRDGRGFVLAQDAQDPDILGYGTTDDEAVQMVADIRRLKGGKR